MRASRARFVSALLSAGTILSLLPSSAMGAFSDVSSRAEFSAAIEALQSRGVIEGYADGTFRPNATINRAEFLKVLLEARKDDTLLQSPTSRNCFPDVQERDWFSDYVCRAKARTVVAGYPDGTFKPEQPVNFVEATKMISLVYGLPILNGSQWYEPYALALEAAHAIPPSIHVLDKKITRSEMAEMMWRLSEGKTDQPHKSLLSLQYPGISIDTTSDAVQYAKSCTDLQAFTEKAQAGSIGFGRGGGPMMLMEGAMAPQAADGNAMKAADSAATANGDYSQTNVQVAGVDEGDIVKTDGTYLYVVTTGKVRIVQAQPASNLKLISTIDLEENAFTPSDLYVNGNRLIILGQRWTPNTGGDPHIMDSTGIMPMEKRSAGDTRMMIWPGPWYGSQKAEVRIYDITDRSKPTMARKVAFDGSTVSSRRIDDKLYLIVNNPVTWGGPVPIPLKATEDILLPKIDDSKTGVRPVAGCNDIAILPHVPSPQYLTVGVIPLSKPSAEIKSTTVLGSADNVYASLDNLYIATTEWNYRWNSVAPETSERTNLFRFAYADDGIDMKAQGSVPGHLLNQFSMDENGNSFRIATTIGQAWRGPNMIEKPSTNNLYILNMNLERVGAIEDIAPGEQIYSIRFLGDRAYMVTFQKIDPFFVIDVADDRHPKILGKLKIPGYSDYLHPYDENHIIGFGKEAIEAKEGNFAWYQGLKMAVFDVTDVRDPKELHTMVIGDRGTESPLLHNHKALLFEKDRNLLTLPITVAEIPASQKQGPEGSAYGQPVFQGAHVYTLTLKDGFKLRGVISHYSADDMQKAGGYWYGGDKDVQRIVRIGDDLLTISNAMVQSHTEDSVEKEGEVTFR